MSETVSAQAPYQHFACLGVKETLAELRSSQTGLKKRQVPHLLARYGANLVEAKPSRWWQVLMRQFRSPFVYILLAAGVLAYILGELIDGSMIMLFIFINASLGFFQEYRSQQALLKLRQASRVMTDVLRQGEWMQLAVTELVPGDITQLQPGDIVPADLRLLQTQHLNLDESILTGESEPVLKVSHELMGSIALHEATNIAFAQTNVVSGQGLGVVVATGGETYSGRMMQLVTETTRPSSFEKNMSLFSHFILKLVSVTLVLVLLANLLIKGEAVDWSEMALFTVALAAAVIPEALPLVITFSLSRGAMLLAKHKVVVKRLAAIEDLGGIQILCTDKTGTITENKLAISAVFGGAKTVLQTARLAVFEKTANLDPIDQAILRECERAQWHAPSFELLAELPFDPLRRRSSALVRRGQETDLIVRGAAEAILPYLRQRSGPVLIRLLAWIEAQERLGRRVVVVTQKESASAAYSTRAEESRLELVGALALTDPVKASARMAIAKAKQLGIKIKVITGDSALVARQVASEVGLLASRPLLSLASTARPKSYDAQSVITGEEFFALSATEQLAVASQVAVFARFSPLQKYQLIELMQQKWEVGYLGDGINDAPALKLANVAVAVAGASDIACEAADVILLNSSLSVLINGIEEGRKVFANSLKYIKMTLASNFGNFYAMAVATLLVPFLPMLPIQILLVNLLSDFPLIAVATDSVHPREVRRPESYKVRDFVLVATVFGILSSAFDFLFFALFFQSAPAVLQTNWFIGSILTELALLYSLRTHLPFFRAQAPSRPIVVLTVLAAMVAISLPYTLFGQTYFHFQPPTTAHLALILGVVGAYFLANEGVKRVMWR